MRPDEPSVRSFLDLRIEGRNAQSAPLRLAPRAYYDGNLAHAVAKSKMPSEITKLMEYGTPFASAGDW